MKPKDSDQGDASDKTFVEFKRVVWHECFKKLLESIQDFSKNGCWVKCGDDVKRWLYPAVIILSADYEEQYVFKVLVTDYI